MVTPFPSILVLHLFKDLQHHPISGLSLAVYLWVVWGGPSILDVICLSQPLHVFVYERGPIVTNQSPGDPDLVMICSRMKFATAAPVAFFKGMASIHFVKYSVAAKIHM